ncbi:MAG TPA: cytochrome c biogenesis protein ResB [Nitrospirae bacterium]|nr:cytochrome c biogenesis protein CcsB [bacterium BMS3Bbin08]HDK17341.1 cytochrome c biogenesis protein ResB [Nitrospirota bacterium]
MENKEKKDVFDIIWDFFSSVKLAVVILISLSLTSIIGTIVEQRADQATNIALLAKFFGDSMAPTVYNIFVKLGFMDMYHSWWFVGLLVLFSINLTVCSLDRFPKTLRLVQTPMKPQGENAIKNLPVKKELSVRSGQTTAKDEVLNSFRSSRYRVFEATGGNAVQLYSQKGKYTRFGVYVVHLSILLIFVGAIIGARLGFRGFLNLPEGDSYSYIYTSDGRTIPLGFTIHCNWYDTIYYKDTNTPQEFHSELVITEGGREILKKVVEVNDPLKYRGITFYQSSYGMIPDAVGEFIIQVTAKGGQEKTLRLFPGETFEISGEDFRGTIVNFSPALTRDSRTGALTTFSDNMINPAVAIEFDRAGEGKSTGWILKRIPETGNLPDGARIRFLDYWGVEYTGLQVSKDPGVGFIYLACILMTIGLYACFFMSHKKIWVNIGPDPSGEKGHTKISVGGTASKNRLAFEKELEKILAKASRSIEERSKK